MIVFQVLKNKPTVFRCLTGMNLVAFQKLLPAFERAYEADLDRRDQARSTKRQRERSGGRNSANADYQRRNRQWTFKSSRKTFDANL